jgi:hypothetical protein
MRGDDDAIPDGITVSQFLTEAVLTQASAVTEQKIQ